MSFPAHNHESFEILYITASTLRAVVDKKEYTLTKGDILIINPFRLHYAEYITLNEFNEHLAFNIMLKK